LPAGRPVSGSEPELADLLTGRGTMRYSEDLLQHCIGPPMLYLLNVDRAIASRPGPVWSWLLPDSPSPRFSDPVL